jgi:hypothetical protein
MANHRRAGVAVEYGKEITVLRQLLENNAVFCGSPSTIYLIVSV